MEGKRGHDGVGEEQVCKEGEGGVLMEKGKLILR